MDGGDIAGIGLGAVGAAAGIAVLGIGTEMIANEIGQIVPRAKKQLKQERSR